MIRVLLVDDQPLVRSGLKLILSSEDGFDVVGECADGANALAAIKALRPAVVVLDIRMKGMDGVEVTRRLREIPDAPPVLILTTFDDDELLSAALHNGVAGFLLKDAPADDLIRATRVVAQGGAWLDPVVTSRVLTAYRSGVLSGANTAVQGSSLTPREREIVRLIGCGATNQEIATALESSEDSVRSEFGRILDKLILRDRAAAIAFARGDGTVQPTA